jgi:hypothetical protein
MILMKHLSLAILGLSLLARAPASRAAPRHDVCADLGPTLAVGISSFSSAGDWLVEAHDTYGVEWRLVYVYLVPPGDDLEGYRWFIVHKAEVARSVGALPVYTFYQLLQIGQGEGLTGSEPEVVQAVLASQPLMRTYFDNFILVLQTVADIPPPVIVHVEPDSWGFMMWAMGIEGNDDPASVPVQVAGSGHPDVSGFPDNAAGLGQALVALRDAYAPQARLGWHASNFRVGTRPEVVASFFSQMGDWDALVGEHPHNELDETRWWEPWDETLVETNLQWFAGVTGPSGLPILLWQLPIGTEDWHLFGNDGDTAMLRRFAEAGVVGLLFEHQGPGDDPDAFRALGELGTTPPADSGAGGTAADLRARLAVYSSSPLPWPGASPCYGTAPADDEAGESVDDPPPDGPVETGEEADAAAETGGEKEDSGEEAGCGCVLAA